MGLKGQISRSLLLQIEFFGSLLPDDNCQTDDGRGLCNIDFI